MQALKWAMKTIKNSNFTKLIKQEVFFVIWILSCTFFINIENSEIL